MSRKMRLVLAAVALVVVIAVAWFFLISPLRADIASTEASIAEQNTELKQAQDKLAAAQTTKAEGKKNQARLMELAKMVPTETQVPSLLVQIQDLADQAGIKFISVSPGEATDSGGFQIIPLQLQFTGSYFDLSDFSYRVEQLVAGPGRLMAVKSISLKPGESSSSDTSTTGSSATAGKSPTLTVSMTLYAFSMNQANPKGSAATASGATTNTTETTSSSTASANATTSN